MKTEIFVSILIPNYNKAHYIHLTLDSVLSQTYPNWECIVVDDQSTDRSWEILEKYASNDSRFRIFQRPNSLKKGGNNCRNYAIEQSKGQFILFLDSDDLLTDFSLELRIKTILKFPNMDFWAFSTALFEKEVVDAQFYWNLPNENESVLSRFLRMDALWQTSGCIYEREFLIRLNGLSPDRSIWQDFELHLKALIVSNSYKIEFCQSPDVFIRTGDPTSLSRSTPFSGNFEILKERIDFLEEVFSFSKEKGRGLTRSEMYSLFSLQYFLILQLWLKHGRFGLFWKKWVRYSKLYGLSSLLKSYGFFQAIILKVNNRLKIETKVGVSVFRGFPDYYILDKVQIGRFPLRLV